MDYDAEEYYRHYILTRLEQVEKDANSSLVTLLKDGRERVYKRDLEEKYGTGKSAIVRLTREYPDMLEEYRANKRNYFRPAMDDVTLAAATGSPETPWDELLAAVTGLPPGRDTATAYHRACERLFSALFYPSLSTPVIEREINTGRKRIDISYSNISEGGFFRFVALNYGAAYVPVECKNYAQDIANPELDQMAGRLAPNRGHFGIIVCRQITDRPLFTQRCRDTALEDKGFISRPRR